MNLLFVSPSVDDRLILAVKVWKVKKKTKSKQTNKQTKIAIEYIMLKIYQ